MTTSTKRPDGGELSFQKRVLNWLMECFSNEVCRDGVERNHRFLEESLELVQSLGCTRSEAHQLVDYVFGRPVGEPFQELGGVMVTMSALASCHDMDFEEAAETELARVWTKIEKIRAKQLAKPKHSPLPEVTPTNESPAPQAADTTDWQSIETAPKDGTPLLAWQDTERGPFKCWWYIDWARNEAYWMDSADSEPNPTSWRPMPPDPHRKAFKLELSDDWCLRMADLEGDSEIGAGLGTDTPAPQPPVEGLREAAQAVIDRWDTPAWKDLPATAVFINRLRAALASPSLTAGWQPIETAPMDEEILMGWWVTWPEQKWEQAAGLYGSTKGGWNHGQATHWQPLPPAPATLIEQSGAEETHRTKHKSTQNI